MDPYRWGAACALMVITMLTCCRCQTEEDEKRPYKFAFAIEGYQHRSEEKDERGIIMGEFGFVTGDGVYHVTVYATDENGDFKILSMKNYYVGLPGEGTTTAPSRAPPPTARTTPPPRTTPPIFTTRSPILQHLDGLKGCSSCVIPDKKKNGQSPRIPSGPTDGGALLGAGPGPSFGKPSLRPSTGTPLTPGAPARGGVNPAYAQRPGGLPAGGAQNALGGSGPTSGVSGGKAPSSGRQPGGGQPQNNRPPGGQSQGVAQKPSRGAYAQPPSTAGGPGTGSDRFGGTPSNQGGGPSGRPQPQGGTGDGSIPGPNKPNKTIPPYSEGLPPGMTMEDLMALLYKFNYTLRYHGHHESGYRNGDKEGGYFFNGRDGLGRNVKYIANEFGFQPNITLVDLGLQSPDTPQEENEEPNEIKGNEFKWFYKR